MQYVADPGDFRNLAKNIQITFTVYRLAACKGTVFLTLCSFLQKLGFRHSFSFFFFSYYKFFAYARRILRRLA